MKTPEPARLDIRPLCANQRPPLSAILRAINRLSEGQALLLIAPFEPVPLYTLLGERGFTHRTRRGDDGAFEVTFEPPKNENE